MAHVSVDEIIQKIHQIYEIFLQFISRHSGMLLAAFLLKRPV